MFFSIKTLSNINLRMLEGESHVSRKVGCYVADDGGKYVTFHELNRRSRKGWKITKAQLDSMSNREF